MEFLARTVAYGLIGHVALIVVAALGGFVVGLLAL